MCTPHTTSYLTSEHDGARGYQGTCGHQPPCSAHQAPAQLALSLSPVTLTNPCSLN